MTNTGLYGNSKEELLNVMNDLDSTEELFIISVKMGSGIVIYSFPGTLDKIKERVNDVVESINNEEVVKIGVTWINTKNIDTVRISKYTGGDNNVY